MVPKYQQHEFLSVFLMFLFQQYMQHLFLCLLQYCVNVHNPHRLNQVEILECLKHLSILINQKSAFHVQQLRLQ